MQYNNDPISIDLKDLKNLLYIFIKTDATY